MSEPDAASDDVPQLVVVGASAGGVEALLTLVASLPARFPAPIVVAQHLDPHRPSQLAALLAGRGALPVRTVAGREPLKRGTIYVVPADRDVEIADHHVDTHQASSRSPKPSVDLLMTTAARTYGDGLIAVILTGTGSDGAAGAQAAKAYGGTVIVQNPETARFPGMPQAVSPLATDIVADLEAIGPLLADLVTGAYALPAMEEEDELRHFLEQIRARTGLDFLAYKRPTIARRLQRRMVAVGRDTLLDYRRYIERHPEEVQRLVASFLVKVTEFFRDPEFFDYLRDHVLPNLVADARERGELRIWSAGCATGEEAYSLAMLIADLLGDDVHTFPVRIFATDIALDAVDFARRGVYPAAALANLPPDVIDRHFVQHDGSFEVRKAVRGLVIFGDHDLGHRAPFPRIDLVLCRNVLIYFTTELQRRALQLFAFSLRHGGYLALGKSESVSPLPEYFSLEQPRLKIFRRVGAVMPIPTIQILDTAPIAPSPNRIARRTLRRLTAFDHESAPMAHRLDGVLDTVSLGMVTVNREYGVIAINATARELLGINTAAIGEDLVHRVAPSLAMPLRKALDAALHGEQSSTLHHTPRDIVEGESRDLSIVCSPMWSAESDTVNEAVLVEVSDVTAFVRRQRTLEEEQSRIQGEQNALREQVAEAVSELRELRTINRTMSIEQGRLRMEAELLQLAHEEAQAAAEEIETLHEEQQATNEELETVNEELQATVEELQATVGELSATNGELEDRTTQLELTARSLEEQRRAGEAERARLAAILANMGDAVIVVDEHGDSILTNPAFDREFGEGTQFSPADETGRLLPRESWPQCRAARGEAFTMGFTLPGPEGTRRFFETNAQPVPGSDGARWGVVVIRDITDRSLRRQQEQFLAVAAHELRTPLTVLSGRLQLLARRLASTSADERLAEHAERALEQARHLEADIDELMDAARLQFGKIILDRAATNLVTIVQRAADTAKTLSSGQTIDVDTPDGAVMIDGDARRLERVLVNVLNNALIYAPGSERIEIRLRTEAEQAVVEVQDRGPGIPAASIADIFSRFVRLEQGPTSRSGLGLGLFIAREIMTAHGGTIEAKSAVGEGTTIVMRLPMLPGEREGSSSLAQSADRRKVS
jgi:two-component system CheB/CheR fusion protein